MCVLQTISVDADYIDFLQSTRSLSHSSQARPHLYRLGVSDSNTHNHMLLLFSQQTQSVLTPISALAAQRSKSDTVTRVRGPRTAAYIRKHKAERKATRESLKRELQRTRELAARAIQISWRRYTCTRDRLATGLPVV